MSVPGKRASMQVRDEAQWQRAGKVRYLREVPVSWREPGPRAMYRGTQVVGISRYLLRYAAPRYGGGEGK
jgi:hypothetical protein